VPRDILDSRTAYSRASRTFHWTTLALVAIALAIIWTVDFFPKSWDEPLVTLHRSIGLTILALTIGRLVYRPFAPKPKLPQNLPKWQIAAARLVQWLLYAVLLIEPVLGWVQSGARGRSVDLFYVVHLPALVGEDRALARQLLEVHEYVAYALLVLVGLHAAAALYHHYIVRDDVLRSMLPRIRPHSA